MRVPPIKVISGHGEIFGDAGVVARVEITVRQSRRRANSYSRVISAASGLRVRQNNRYVRRLTGKETDRVRDRVRDSDRKSEREIDREREGENATEDLCAFRSVRIERNLD